MGQEEPRNFSIFGAFTETADGMVLTEDRWRNRKAWAVILFAICMFAVAMVYTPHNHPADETAELVRPAHTAR